jgi:multidrug efflux pump subunit AcrB
MSPENSYLDRLRFNADLAKGVVGSYLRNFRLSLLLITTIVGVGFVSYLNLPQRLNPEIKIPIVSITTILPGAAPQDIESLVTIPLEDGIDSVKGIDTITSTSRENMSMIQIQFVSGIEPKSAEQEVQTAVNKITSLPTDATTPQVKAFDFEDQPIWQFSLQTKEELPSLMRFSETLKKEIEKVSNVDRVTTSGFETKEIQIIVEPEKMRQYGLNPQSLMQSIKRASSSFPGGNLNTGKNTISFTINPEITTVQDIRDMRLTVNNTIVRLSDIAIVQERPQDNQTKSLFVSKTQPTPIRVVNFAVYKTQGSDINKTSDAVKKSVNTIVKDNNNKYTLTTVINTSDEIRKQFSDLLGEFQSTIILVFICLFLFVGLRQAIIAAVTVPLTFLAAFALMPLFGMSINFLVLFAFLLSLGLLIDDTIVIVSGMTTYFRSGKFTPYQTGLLVWKDLIVPIWSTTITTIWAFVPLLLATGIIGEFIKPIPIVISLVMISSTAISVLITLPLMIIILKPQLPSRIITLFKLLFFVLAVGIIGAISPKNIMLPLVILAYFALLFVLIKIRGHIKTTTSNFVTKRSLLNKSWSKIKEYSDKPILHLDSIAIPYKRMIRRILDSKSARRQVLAAIIIFSLVSYALVPLGFVKNEFFPKTDENTLFINIEYPSGTNEDIVTQKATEVLTEIQKTQYVKFVTADVGQSVGGMGAGGGNQAIVGYTLHLEEKGDRKKTSIELADELREKFKNYTPGTVSVIEESGGPPAGSDLQISLSGDDLGVVDRYADKIVQYLKTQKGITNVSKSLKAGPSQIVFIPNKDIMTKNNVTTDQVGGAIRLFTSGLEMDKIKFKGNGNDEERVLLKLGTDNGSPDEIGKIMIQSGQNQLPLESLGKLELQASPTEINREDKKRVIAVSAGIQVGQANTTEEGQKLEQFATNLHLPNGYAWKTGGVNEENAKSVQSIIQAMGVAFVLILVTMVIQFGSFRQAFIALVVIPLAVSSVFFVFALTGTPLSFPALIGILALFGIIVTNSMFIIDKINLNRKNGMPFKESIADAGSSRLEPIVLTKLCTVLGLLPITLSEPLWRGLGGAIISGVLLASTFMLLFIPVVYYSFFAKEEERKDQEDNI